MNRRGFALLLVLWLLVLVGSLVAVSLGGGRVGSSAIRNRQLLTRAGWAREACLEILLARTEADTSRRWTASRFGLDSIDLGGDVWCSLTLDDPGSRLQVNTASLVALRAAFQDSSLANAVARGRPWPAPSALLPLLRDHNAESWLPLLTTRGTGRVNLSTAPASVLASLPGMTPEGAARMILARPRFGFTSLDEALALAPPSVRASILIRYEAFVAVAEVEPEVLIATSIGHERDGPLAVMTVTLVPAGRRLAVVRRETE